MNERNREIKNCLVTVKYIAVEIEKNSLRCAILHLKYKKYMYYLVSSKASFKKKPLLIPNLHSFQGLCMQIFRYSDSFSQVYVRYSLTSQYHRHSSIMTHQNSEPAQCSSQITLFPPSPLLLTMLSSQSPFRIGSFCLCIFFLLFLLMYSQLSH